MVKKLEGRNLRPTCLLLYRMLIQGYSNSRMSPQSSITDQPIMAVMAEAYVRYDARAKRWLKEYAQQGGTVHCGSGCFHCCNMPVKVSLAEALLTASALTTTQLEAMKRRAFEVLANARAATNWDEFFQYHRERIGYCPLLDTTTRACTAYEARPARCRDTYSALSSDYCRVGVLENLNRQEHLMYVRQVRANPVTDGVNHYIAPLEDMSQNIWQTASDIMRKTWGLEVWGDFWVLTTLSQDLAFMTAVRGGQFKRALQRAKTLRLWHVEILEIT